ncbi:outer membrane protein assembly factor BamE [Oceanibium sediminis]|uniref:outer membrane protein assembly factor BamE n=1 Tax=Oceanibium sediminis TaxID=2026339 RepID=UPI00130062BB|nr:outer membrane protein assembly factor BamE [Oceanibium sediminis]
MTEAFKRILQSTCAAVLLGLAACAPAVTVHGYVPSQEELDGITPGVDTTFTIEERVGRPSSTSLLGESDWYYVQTTISQLTYNPPEVTDRKVVALAFNDSGVLEDVQTYGLEDGRIINLSPRVTPTGGQRQNVLQRIFAGLLNFDAGSFVDG